MSKRTTLNAAQKLQLGDWIKTHREAYASGSLGSVADQAGRELGFEVSDSSDKKPIPTIGIEARQIVNRLESMQVGDVVTYEELETITKRPRERMRESFYTAARAIFRDRGWVFGCVQQVGYKRLDATEKIDDAEIKRRHIHRTAKRAGDVLASVEVKELPPDQQLRFNRELAFAGAIALATSRKCVRALETELKVRTDGLPSPDVLALFAK